MELAPNGSQALFLQSAKQTNSPKGRAKRARRFLGFLGGFFLKKIPLSRVQGQRPCQGLGQSPKVLHEAPPQRMSYTLRTQSPVGRPRSTFTRRWPGSISK